MIYTKNSRNARRRRERAEKLLRMICVAIFAVIVCVLLMTPVPAEDNASAVDRAAMVAAAARYSEVLERTGDRYTADALAQELYLELGGTRDYWQGRAEE